MNECPECKLLFIPVKSWQKFCSVQCKERTRRTTTKYKKYSQAYMKEYSTTPIFKYNVHKQDAKRRGIDFILSFEEWWSYWEPFWNNRGKGVGKFCMSRFGDVGPYAVGNIFINLYEENCKDAAIKQNQTRDINTGRFK